MFYRALWSYACNSAANAQLAQIYSARGDFDSAIERLDEALAYNARNIPALNLKTAVLRAKGEKNAALETAEKTLALDPVNAFAAREKDILSGGGDFKRLMRDEPESYIELALAYKRGGFAADAAELLEYIDAKTGYATAKMWLGNLADESGDKARAEKYFREALDRRSPTRSGSRPRASSKR